MLMRNQPYITVSDLAGAIWFWKVFDIHTTDKIKVIFNNINGNVKYASPDWQEKFGFN